MMPETLPPGFFAPKKWQIIGFKSPFHVVQLPYTVMPYFTFDEAVHFYPPPRLRVCPWIHYRRNISNRHTNR